MFFEVDLGDGSQSHLLPFMDNVKLRSGFHRFVCIALIELQGIGASVNILPRNSHLPETQSHSPES